MRRPRLPALAAAALALAAAGCQDYRFNPVNRCLIQPGSERVSIADVSSADVLFVVDDSGSMAGEQLKLATAFDQFVGSLHAFNDQRAAAHLEPFDFHIAITTTSLFADQPTVARCESTCGTLANVCGTWNSGHTLCSPTRIAKTCPGGTGCGTGFSCKTTCSGHAGEAICCDASGATIETTTLACTTPGATCGSIQNRYAFDRQAKTCTSSSQCTTSPYTTCTSTAQSGSSGSQLACGAYPGSLCCALKPCTTDNDCGAGFSCGGYSGVTNVCISTAWGYPAGTPQLDLACVPGVAEEGTLYPQGSFVGIGTNPRVLHFDKSLYATDGNGDGYWDPVPNRTNATNRQGFTRADLLTFFGDNVRVGTCGSGQEQGLQAARLAISKALTGQQHDVRNSSGTVVADPGVVADWPHANGKLVVVYVGDEDDCSGPADPVRGVLLYDPQNPSTLDGCRQDAQLPLAQQREFLVTDLMSDLRALNRPLGAGFVVSAVSQQASSTQLYQCVDADCTAGVCVPPPSACTGETNPAFCGGQAPGARFLEAARVLRDAGDDVVSASVCDPGFGTILGRIAEIVKPPTALTLPSTPASGELTLLRITDAAGDTRKLCRGPAPATLDYAGALSAGYDWWFTASSDQTYDADKHPSGPSRFVYVNHATFQCEPNPGEGYSADFIAVVPQGGCTSDAACTTALGSAIQWTCYSGTNPDGTCVPPSASAVGTCLCNPRSVVCPKG